jgi:hypothetical protein
MTFLIGPHEFAGPFGRLRDLEDREGVFVLLARCGEEYELLRAGEASEVRTALQAPGMWNSLQQIWSARLLVAACYTNHLSLEQRRRIVRCIMRELCGHAEEPNVDLFFVKEPFFRGASDGMLPTESFYRAVGH